MLGKIWDNKAKMWVAAIIPFIGALLLQKLSGGELDPQVINDLSVTTSELVNSLIMALVTSFTVYGVPNVPNPPKVEPKVEEFSVVNLDE